MANAEKPILGVIAGAGKFPVMVIEGARAEGCRVPFWV